VEPQFDILLFNDTYYVRFMDYRALQEQRDLLLHLLSRETTYTMDDGTIGCGLCLAATAPSVATIKHESTCPLVSGR
jgi:hypothetical protein